MGGGGRGANFLVFWGEVSSALSNQFITGYIFFSSQFRNLSGHIRISTLHNDVM